MNRVGLIALSGVSGMAVMAAEMGLVRALAPYFGQTTYVWMIIIGVVLAALSVGYWAGGILAERWNATRPLCLTLMAGGAALILATLLVTPLSTWLLPAPGAPIESLNRTLLLGAFAVALVLVGPPIGLLGVTGPWVTRLLAGDGMPVGRAAGVVLAVSTIGSLFGTFLPPLFLIPWLGSRLTVILAAVVLIAAAALVLGLPRGRNGAAGAALLAALVAGGWWNATGPLRPSDDLLWEAESPYQYIRVTEQRWTGQDKTEQVARALHLNEGQADFHSKITNGQALTFGYYDWYLPLAGVAAGPGDSAKPPLRIAILGLAGGAHSHVFHQFCAAHYALQIDGVEIDPRVVEAARTHLWMDAAGHPHLRVHTADARPWLQASAGPFDLIIVDAFTQQMYVPFYLASKEFFELVKSRLTPGGVMAFNVYPAEANGKLVGAFGATLQAVFGEHVWGLRLPRTGGNFLVVARNERTITPGELRHVANAAAAHAEAGGLWRCTWQLERDLKPLPANGPVLTDDHSPVEILTEQDLAAMRRAALQEAR